MKVLQVLFLATFVFFVAVFVWTGFDIHNRLSYMMLAQIPMLVMLVILKLTKRGVKNDVGGTIQ